MTERPPLERRAKIHYTRLPDDEQVFDQRIVLARPEVIVTVTDPMKLLEPMIIRGRPALEPGSRVVWFTFPGRWYDVGRFHLADGSFTGCYGNVLTPPEIDGDDWRTTDLFVDVWLVPGEEPALLDEDELGSALAAGHIEPEMAERARAVASDLLQSAKRGTWPPPIVGEWTLERVLDDERR